MLSYRLRQTILGVQLLRPKNDAIRMRIGQINSQIAECRSKLEQPTFARYQARLIGQKMDLENKLRVIEALLSRPKHLRDLRRYRQAAVDRNEDILTTIEDNILERHFA